jgi:hypothetical protein
MPLLVRTAGSALVSTAVDHTRRSPGEGVKRDGSRWQKALVGARVGGWRRWLRRSSSSDGYDSTASNFLFNGLSSLTKLKLSHFHDLVSLSRDITRSFYLDTMLSVNVLTFLRQMFFRCSHEKTPLSRLPTPTVHEEEQGTSHALPY